jgi:hypothetical protein
MRLRFWRKRPRATWPEFPPIGEIRIEDGMPRVLVMVDYTGYEETVPLGTFYAKNILPLGDPQRRTLGELLESEGWRRPEGNDAAG